MNFFEYRNAKEQTGYKPEVLLYIYEKYCQFDFSIQNFYRIYKFIHKFPTRRQVSDDLGCSSWYLHEHLIPYMSILANKLNEIHWNDRLCVWNHGYHFPLRVTAIWDTEPIYIQEPINSKLKEATYSGKYGTNCYKLQVATDFLGRCLYFSGPHIGT